MQLGSRTRGYRFFGISPGVYAHVDETAEVGNYMWCVPVFGDGVFGADKWEDQVGAGRTG